MADELPYIIEICDQATERVEDVKARLGSSILAQAAYNAAVREYGDKQLVILRWKARIMMRSDRDER
jgi:hypothetical protein